MEVRFSHATSIFLRELIQILYEEDYFGFEEAAIEYVNDLVDDIQSGIARKHKKPAPSYFDKYGQNMYYVSYKRNKNTTWYIFFNYSEDVYYIRYIGNNHTISHYLSE
ncbi:hypothetical protein CLV62_104152 [Dysgonomonas alginatilytica]|uniref:ParE-like toxin of type II ParDE toxin-antitoxin system n=1 Tax=Dysgonomonas alginatilytica TaxID=1605892 RepID=A0A2V3PTN2_9BACT|nr:hypothetical protein [Dysgonomonas alginatilytica]PXV66891.1 hypothetical protein CLV62_104152 [Dysgonomonas alginatilytica]